MGLVGGSHLPQDPFSLADGYHVGLRRGTLKMKFGKDFKKQMVPEWTEAYMDYNGLKRILREIWHFKQSKKPLSTQISFKYRAFSGLNLQANDVQTTGDIEDQVISVNTMHQEDSKEIYNTKFLMSPEEGGEGEITFFGKLDNELNKVNTFYTDKVKESMIEAASLNKQMDALIALRIKVEKPNFDDSSSLRHLSKDVADKLPLRFTDGTRAWTPGMGHMDLRRGDLMSNRYQQEECSESPSGRVHMELTHGVDMAYDRELEECANGPELDEVITTTSTTVCGEERSISENKPAPLEILDHVRINKTLESPISTIRGVLKVTNESDLSYRKEELRKVEERLKLVFVEFYRKLHLLKHYSFVNLSAFSKIVKKYEKITSRRASRSYMKMVDISYIGGSDEVTGLMERVEAAFIEHFSNSNRREGMKFLRPKHKREKHSITFFSGFFSGCSIALLVAVVCLFESRKLMGKEEGTLYMENIFQLYSLYAYIVLHMLLYAANIYFWRLYRINYTFIFGYKQGTELGYREVFFLSTGLAVLALATFLAHLHMKIGLKDGGYEIYAELVPLGLAVVILIMTFCPVNIAYRPSRFFLIRCISRCICAPLYQVTLPDFFLADQLTSQIQAIRNCEFYICYYFSGEFSNKRNECHSHEAYNVFYFIVAVIPYWIRFLQCLRRFLEDKDIMHGYNGLRYFLTIIAVVIRTFFELKKGLSWMVLALVSSAVATIANTYWDIIVDWGLLQRQSKNFCLRDKLVVRHKSVYFAAMVLDILLRFAWLQLLLKFNMWSLHGKSASSLVACLEILRRGMWNFFRLENEHLNNVGKYRAFKSVPLPFNYYDEEIEKDD